MTKKKTSSIPLEFEGGKAVQKFSFKIQARPILKDNKVILFATTKKQKTKYRIIDLKDGSIEQTVNVSCDDALSFNINQTVFALNENDDKVYFIQNDTDVLTMHFTENQIVSLNKSITVSNGNHAQIGYNNKTLYILGAEEKSDEDESYTLVPYSTAVTLQSDEPEDGKKEKPRIKNFGENAQTLAVQQDGAEYLYTFGGRTKKKHEPTINGELWRYILTNCDNYTDDPADLQSQRWQYSNLAQPSLFPGVINYNDRFLVSFGGSVIADKTREDPSDRVYVLALKEEKGLTKNVWYLLNRRLPKKRWFHAIYQKDEDVAHLLSIPGKGSEKNKGSEYFRISMKQIEDEIACGVETGGEHGITSLDTWSRAGKTAIPTKVSVPNLGPKLDELGDSDSD